MSVEQVAHELGVSENTARSLLKRPGAPKLRVLGDRIKRLPRPEFEAWADNFPIGEVDDEPPQLTSARQRAREGTPPAPAPFDAEAQLQAASGSRKTRRGHAH